MLKMNDMLFVFKKGGGFSGSFGMNEFAERRRREKRRGAGLES